MKELSNNIRKSLKMRLIFTLIFGAFFAFGIFVFMSSDPVDIFISLETIAISGLLFILFLISSIQRLVYLARQKK